MQGSSYRHYWGPDTDSSAMPGTGSPMNVFVDMMVLLAFSALCRKCCTIQSWQRWIYTGHSSVYWIWSCAGHIKTTYTLISYISIP